MLTAMLGDWAMAFGERRRRGDRVASCTLPPRRFLAANRRVCEFGHVYIYDAETSC